ncbi:MAG: hypothetical protein HYX92_12095 [Chloroflexi bacterium]|nr:hypothetical protein [Chloroflexota bacterium]
MFDLGRLRGFDRITMALAAMAAVLALAGVMMSQQGAEAANKRAAAQNRASQVSRQFEQFKAQNDKVALRAELERLSAASSSSPRAFPSRPAALGLSNALITYSLERGLLVDAWRLDEVNTSVGNTPYPAVRVNLGVRGSQEALIGMLRLTDQFGTAVVESLQLANTGAEGWQAKLVFVVLYETPTR